MNDNGILNNGGSSTGSRDSFEDVYKRQALLAQELGMGAKRICILENGDALTYNNKRVTITKGFVPAEPVFVDGFGVGDVGSIVLRDRKILSEAGLIVVVTSIDGSTKRVVSGPDIVSRGFVYVKENEDLIEKARTIAESTLERCADAGTSLSLIHI